MYPSPHDYFDSDAASYIPVTGRRWRGPQLNIPERLRAELVSELIFAKFVMSRLPSDDESHERAQRRVGDAERALGERIDRFDEARCGSEATVHAVSTVRALLRARPASDTVTAGEVASVVAAAGWQRAVDVVNRALDQLVASGELVDVDAHPEGERARGPAAYERRIARGHAFA